MLPPWRCNKLGRPQLQPTLRLASWWDVASPQMYVVFPGTVLPARPTLRLPARHYRRDMLGGSHFNLGNPS